jgi:plasmid stabilization system protein ParE
VKQFSVVVEPPAATDIEAAYLYLHERAPAAAARWLARLQRAIENLSILPSRCGIARESKEFAEPIRQLLYGKRGGRYRVLFVIRGQTVHVIHVRHGARDELRSGELEDFK